MSRVENFLTEDEEQEIVQAILKAEKNTSGEIRVHIEAHTRSDYFERAKEVFHLLKMDNTKEENGVLIYVAVMTERLLFMVIEVSTRWFPMIFGRVPKMPFKINSKRKF